MRLAAETETRGREPNPPPSRPLRAPPLAPAAFPPARGALLLPSSPPGAGGRRAEEARGGRRPRCRAAGPSGSGATGRRSGGSPAAQREASGWTQPCLGLLQQKRRGNAEQILWEKPGPYQSKQQSPPQFQQSPDSVILALFSLSALDSLLFACFALGRRKCLHLGAARSLTGWHF